jgi:hypothetical protein
MEPSDRLSMAEESIADTGLTVMRGNAYEPWDLESVGGLLASGRFLMAVENHGSGRQYIRFAAWPRYSKLALALVFLGCLMATWAWWDQQLLVACVLALGTALLLLATLLEAGRSLAGILEAAKQQEESVPRETRPEIFNSGPGVARVQISARRSPQDA